MVEQVDDRTRRAICADYEVSDAYSRAASAGASVVFHCAAPGLNPPRRDTEDSWQQGFDWWRSSCIEKDGAYAREFGLTVCIATQAGSTTDEDFPGWAAVIGPNGKITAELPDWRAGTLIADV